MLHHASTHLAPTAAVVGNLRNARADTMTITLMNHVALQWIQKMHSDLLTAVSTEYAMELRNGTQLAELVQRISENYDSLIRKHSGGASNHFVQTEVQADPSQVNWINSGSRNLQTHGGPWSGQRGAFRGFQRGRGGGYSGQASRGGGQQSGASGQFCPKCNALGRMLNIKVDFRHLPASCPVKPAQVRSLTQDGSNGDGEQTNFEEEPEDEQYCQPQDYFEDQESSHM